MFVFLLTDSLRRYSKTDQWRARANGANPHGKGNVPLSQRGGAQSHSKTDWGADTYPLLLIPLSVLCRIPDTTSLENSSIFGSKEALSVLMHCAPVFVYISSSALLGRPRCGLSMWLSLLSIFNTIFWVFKFLFFIFHEKMDKTREYGFRMVVTKLDTPKSDYRVQFSGCDRRKLNSAFTCMIATSGRHSPTISWRHEKTDKTRKWPPAVTRRAKH